MTCTGIVYVQALPRSLSPLNFTFLKSSIFYGSDLTEQKKKPDAQFYPQNLWNFKCAVMIILLPSQLQCRWATWLGKNKKTYRHWQKSTVLGDRGWRPVVSKGFPSSRSNLAIWRTFTLVLPTVPECFAQPRFFRVVYIIWKRKINEMKILKTYQILWKIFFGGKIGKTADTCF